MRHDGEVPQPTHGGGRAILNQQPDAEKNLDPQCGQRQQRQRPPDKEIVAENPAQTADRVERQRRVVVADKAVGRRVEPLTTGCGVLKIGVPGLGRPDLDQEMRPPYRPGQEIDRGKRQHQQVERTSDPVAVDKRHAVRRQHCNFH